MIFNKQPIFIYEPEMLQLLFLLGITWILLWFFNDKQWWVLGFKPTPFLLKYGLWGFIIAAFFSLSTYLLKMYFTGEVYGMASNLKSGPILLGFWQEIRSVLTEELIFRGALFYLVYKKWGSKPAIIISSVAFAAIHLLTVSAWNNPIQISMLLAFTFLMGLLLAFAFIQSGSILIPFAIHFGWNCIQNFAFGENGNNLRLFELKNTPPEVTISYAAFFTLLLLPKIGAILGNYLLLKHYPKGGLEKSLK